MKKKILTVLIILVIGVILVRACSKYKLDVVADSDPLRPTFIVEDEPVYVSFLDVGEYGIDDKWHTVWVIKAKWEKGQEKHPGLSKVKYGVVPDGYEELRAAKKLEKGHIYYVGVSDGDNTKTVNFKIIELNGKLVIRKLIKDKKSGKYMYLEEDG